MVELLVVIAIIGVLVALLLPAIQAAREAARRSSCGNNLKQIGLGLQNYHDARKTFPYACVYTAAGSTSISQYQGPNWVVGILPFIEGGNVITLYNKNAFWVDDATNISFHSANLPFMMCPSDPNAATPFDATLASTGTSGATISFSSKAGVWGRGCYAANAVVNSTVIIATAGNGNTANTVAWTNLLNRGVMLPNVACSMKQITDGTSKTVAVAEIRADLSAGSQRGQWAGTWGNSALFGFGGGTATIDSASTPSNDVGPNNAGGGSGTNYAGDWTNTCTTTNGSNTAAGSAQMAVQMGMGCNQSSWGDKQIGPKSMHPGGVQVVFCDGSVHWIDDSIQVSLTSAPAYWEMLFLSSDGGSLPQDVYNQ